MLKNIRNLLHILSIGVALRVLRGHPYYNISYGIDNSQSKLSKLLGLGIGVVDIIKQNQHYIDQEVPDMTPQFGEAYDFIVIGAGTAGATIAARLSEVSQLKILLIEAGFHESLFMGIPLIAPILSLNNNINWKYKTKPSNKYCRGMKDNSCSYPRGKIVGGSSVLNFMLATRGGVEDYDRWAAMGNDGWAYKDVLKYFKKLETMDIPELKSDITYHGTDGPIHINYPLFRTPLAEAYLEAGKELRYPTVDPNGKNLIGFSYVQATIMNGTRVSSNRAYLHPVHSRKNLHMTLQSTVTKVIIDSNTNQAIGVEFVKYDQTIRVFAKKEVILCAGAIGSPQLLMLSGIGPAKHLTELGIDVLQNAPVGENLMDHVTFYGMTWTINASIGFNFIDLKQIKSYITEFLIKRSGPLTVPSGIEAFGFINTKHPEKRSSLPDIELVFSAGTFKEDFTFPRILGLKDAIIRKWNKYAGTYGWSVGSILLKPKSRGKITLLANDVNVKPEIAPNYFDDPDDVATMIAGIRTALRIGQTKTMQAFDSQLLNFTYVECKNYEYDSDVYWECMIRLLSSTLFHACGTCKMGPRGDPTAVVDPRLKVIGIQGLRVADASIMPEIVSAHTAIPVFMIAEKAADIIKEEWGYL
ncbi:PREDICTED: glucose dehydrogenase [FAD, quinone]-like [Wasmannia auropunctata]|uniref:glucose dehydrogenase [FAD, quinone]-like n=1 Tax=Wasmannia auropunctata TaxID=64793 RepID=UPI0005EEB690|nr:PREDICTED: glucose dehydrogenase [FAD, quinone]-like [Wasmannia auropunctata]